MADRRFPDLEHDLGHIPFQPCPSRHKSCPHTRTPDPSLWHESARYRSQWGTGRTKIRWPSGWHDLALRPSLEQNGLLSGTGTIAERANSKGCLVFVCSQHVVEALMAQSRKKVFSRWWTIRSVSKAALHRRDCMGKRVQTITMR